MVALCRAKAELAGDSESLPIPSSEGLWPGADWVQLSRAREVRTAWLPSTFPVLKHKYEAEDCWG